MAFQLLDAPPDQGSQQPKTFKLLDAPEQSSPGAFQLLDTPDQPETPAIAPQASQASVLSQQPPSQETFSPWVYAVQPSGLMERAQLFEKPKYPKPVENELDKLGALPAAQRRQVVAQGIANLPEKDRGAWGDIIFTRFGDSYGLPTTKAIEIPLRALSKKEQTAIQIAHPEVAVNEGPISTALNKARENLGPTTGAMVGGAAGFSRTPGPWWAKALGGLTGMVAGAIIGDTAQKLAEEKLLTEQDYLRLQQQRNAELQQHPIASFVGEVAPSALFLRPSASGLKAAGSLAKQLTGSGSKEAAKDIWTAAAPEAKAYLINGAFGGGVNTTLQTIRESFSENGIDQDALARILVALGSGLTQTKPTGLGKAVGFPELIETPRVPKLADIVPENQALAGLREASPEQVRTPIDQFMARATSERPQPIPTSEADRISSSIPLDEAGRQIVGNEPTSLRLPDILTAEEAAAQGLPFQRGAVTRNAADEAAIAAGRTAEEATILAQRENTMQELANELSQLTGEPFERIVARRAGKTDAAWLRELNAGVEEAKLNAANREADLAATPPPQEDIALPGEIRYLETANKLAAEQTKAFNDKVLRTVDQFRRDGIPINAETRRAASALASAQTPAEYNLLRKGVYDRFAPKVESTTTHRKTLKSLSDLETPHEGVSNAKQPNAETGPVSPEQGVAPEQAPAGQAAGGNPRQAPSQEVAPDPFAPRNEAERIARARPSEPSQAGVKSYGATESARVDRPPSTPEEDLAAYKQLDATFDALPNKEKLRYYESTAMLREDLKNRHFGGNTPTDALLSERYTAPKAEVAPKAAPKEEPKVPDFWEDAYAKAESEGIEVVRTNARTGKSRKVRLEEAEASKALKTQKRVVNNLRAILDCLSR